MGSNGDRTKKSMTTIRRPKKVFALGLGTPDGGEVAAEICIPSFQKKVAKSNLTTEGVSVQLQKSEDLYNLMIGGTVIGYLNSKTSLMISKCAELGVRYKGQIVIKNNSPYANFVRVS